MLYQAFEKRERPVLLLPSSTTFVLTFFVLSSQKENQLRMKLMATAHTTQGQGGSKTDQVTAYLKGLTSKEVTRPTMILVALFFFQNCTGFIATIFYSVDIFKVSGLIK